MKEYIRCVRRQLPRKLRREVLRDLEEIFASAAEHGESEAVVIERLGPPEAFAQSVCEPLAAPRRRKFLWPALLCTFAACALAAGLWLRPRVDGTIIGQADAMTTIRIVRQGLEAWQWLLLLAALLGIAAVSLGIWHRKKVK